MIYCGIDPGLYGSVAIIHPQTPHPIIVDTPILKNGSKNDYVISGMVNILNKIGNQAEHRHVIVGVESVHSMPGQGVTSSFSFGRGLGIWQGILGALEIPYEMVTPQRWKKAMMNGRPKEKQASIIVAKELFPTADITLKKHHGRADSLLIAEHMRRTHKGFTGI